MHLPSGCFYDIKATPHKLRDPSWTPGQWSAGKVFSESQQENFKMCNETMKKISQGKFQPLKASLTKRWEVATRNEKENCLKTAEMSCRLVCGVIAPNDPDKLYEARVTATEKRISHGILALTTAYKNAPTKNLKIQILSLYVLNYSTEELKKLHEPFEKLSDRQIKKARLQAKVNERKRLSCAHRHDETRSPFLPSLTDLISTRCCLWSTNPQTREWRTFSDA